MPVARDTLASADSAKDARLRGLRNIVVEGQRTLPTGATMPLAATSDEPTRSLDQWVSLVKGWKKSDVDAVLAKHGALLLRDIPVKSADDFSRLLHAFGVGRSPRVVSRRSSRRRRSKPLFRAGCEMRSGAFSLSRDLHRRLSFHN